MAVGRPPEGTSGKLELQMTSMIDVVFLLLIFFIITLQIPKEEAFIETNLPRAPEAGQNKAEELDRMEFQDVLVTLVIDSRTGAVRKYINDERMLTAGQMLGKLKSFQSLNEKGRVIISCGLDVPYSDLIEVISVAQISKLSIAFANLSRPG